MSDDDLSDFSMLGLFRLEVEGQAASLHAGLDGLAAGEPVAKHLEALMRAAHSVKGGARMVDLVAAVRISEVMEECFIGAQALECALHPAQIDELRHAVDLLSQISQLEESDSAAWIEAHRDDIDRQVMAVEAITAALPAQAEADSAPAGDTSSTQDAAPPASAATPDNPMADSSMLDLFRTEVETQTSLLTDGLLELEKDPTAADQLEKLMRAAHSIKGAARMVGMDQAVQVAHIMEDGFVAAQAGKVVLDEAQIDLMLSGVDMLSRIGELDPAGIDTDTEITPLVNALGTILSGKPADPLPQRRSSDPPVAADAATKPAAAPRENSIRVSAENLNRMVGLSGQVRVEARWLRPYLDSLVQTKHRQAELIGLMDKLREALEGHRLDEYTSSLLNDVQHRASDIRQLLSDRLTELEDFDRRSNSLADRLNSEVISSRMRPFADGVHGFQRMVRDIARTLGKKVHLDIRGRSTQVDRDILEKIEAPLNHLVRNSLDHGIELPDQRLAAGKPEQATLKVEAMHSSGMLSIVVEDDGRGIDLEKLRRKVVAKGMVTEDMAAKLTEVELMEFLFLPGFSTRDEVTEISGRGVGLDVVHSVVQEMRGVVRAVSRPGEGMRFQLELPLTLSVIRALLVEIAGEPFAFPLARIDRTLKLHRDNIETLEGRQYFTLGNQHIGIVAANQVLQLDEAPPQNEEAAIIVLGERLNRYGLVVDRFLGERHLAVQALDPRLGKIPDVSSAALLEDGTPCLIMDVDDLLRSVDLLVAGGRLNKIRDAEDESAASSTKRILVVDDSITVREVERKMLAARGYQVEVAVDGMDGWNAVRTSHYDLVISDIDMPRMNGFEFVGLIKQDPGLKATPVMIVSYKDREEDRARGLEVGADYYLTKGSFHDETLLDVVVDLIGEARP